MTDRDISQEHRNQLKEAPNGQIWDNLNTTIIKMSNKLLNIKKHWVCTNNGSINTQSRVRGTGRGPFPMQKYNKKSFESVCVTGPEASKHSKTTVHCGAAGELSLLLPQHRLALLPAYSKAGFDNPKRVCRCWMGAHSLCQSTNICGPTMWWKANMTNKKPRISSTEICWEEDDIEFCGKAAFTREEGKSSNRWCPSWAWKMWLYPWQKKTESKAWGGP